MSISRLLIGVMILVPAFVIAGCASAPSGQLAATDCKIVAADFVNKPSKNVTRAEQADAEMRMDRLAYQRRYGIRNNLAADVARECY